MNPDTFSQPRLRMLIPQRITPGLARGKVHLLAGTCMGTSWSVRVVDDGLPLPPDLSARIDALLQGIEGQMSHFQAHSDLRRFAVLPAGSRVALPAEFARVLRGALQVASLSDGAFDPTLAAQIDAWGFGAGKHFSEAGFIPPRLDSTTPDRAGWKSLAIDEHNQIQQPGGVALNLAAIAKGYAVDAASEFLTQSGWQNHLVEVGGELRGAGMKPGGLPWWVALELPAADCPLPATQIALHGLAVATSGNYRRRYLLDDRLIQHTIDPRSGLPLVNTLASVTVIHPECMFADAWATALMVLGFSAGLALAEKLQLCALLQGHDDAGNWTEATSRAWTNLQQ